MAGRLLSLVAALGVAAAGPAQQKQSDTFGGAVVGQQLNLNRVPFNVAAEAIMRRVSDRPYLLCDKALEDKRLISLRFEPFQLRLSVVAATFAAYGYRLRDVGGVYHVCGTEDRVSGGTSGSAGVAGAAGPVGVQGATQYPAGLSGRGGGDDFGSGVAGGAGVPVGSPLDGAMASGGMQPASKAGVARSTRAVSELQALEGYRPDYVAPTALRDALAALLPEVSFAIVEAPGQKPTLFARGAPDMVEQFHKAVAYLDVAADSVEVQAIISEVSTTGRSGFGISVILDSLRSTVGVQLGSGGAGNSLSFRSGAFDAVLSAVSSTANVQVVSAPRLVGRAGEKLSLQVGQEVPTLGAVIENPLGSNQVSVQYRESGSLLDVTARVFGRRIALDFHQELSAFAQTETGVNGSPTLIKRAIDTKADLESGEWVVIGGLRTVDRATTKNGLFGIPLGKEKTLRQAELVILLNVRRVQSARSQSAPLARVGSQDGGARN